MWKVLVPTVLLGISMVLLQSAWGCNEAICGSVVSKCLLTKSCNCDFNYENCSCCKDCMSCLSYLYTECCSCVEMCPKPNDSDSVSSLSKKSHVEDNVNPVPGLFDVLTESSEPAEQWISFSYSIDLDLDQYLVKKDIKLHMQSAEQEVVPQRPNFITKNCTVAFWSDCMSWTKCKSNCMSMGASSYRWFHDGCCECIGQHCMRYGLNESRCKNCKDQQEPLPEENELDFGEDDEDYLDDESE